MLSVRAVGGRGLIREGGEGGGCRRGVPARDVPNELAHSGRRRFSAVGPSLRQNGGENVFCVEPALEPLDAVWMIEMGGMSTLDMPTPCH